MGERPEGWVGWGFRVTPEESSPQQAGAAEHGMFQHVDGRTELPPQSSAERRLHRVFSHTFFPPLFFFVLLCSHTTTVTGPFLSRSLAGRGMGRSLAGEGIGVP